MGCVFTPFPGLLRQSVYTSCGGLRAAGRAVSMNLESSTACTVVVTSPLATSPSLVQYTNRQFGHQRTHTKRIAIVRSLVNGCLDVLSSFLSSLSTHYFSEIYSSARYNNCLNCAHSTVSDVRHSGLCRRLQSAEGPRDAR